MAEHLPSTDIIDQFAEISYKGFLKGREKRADRMGLPAGYATGEYEGFDAGFHRARLEYTCLHVRQLISKLHYTEDEAMELLGLGGEQAELVKARLAGGDVAHLLPARELRKYAHYDEEQ